jgi:hypothetical protein
MRCRVVRGHWRSQGASTCALTRRAFTSTTISSPHGAAVHNVIDLTPRTWCPHFYHRAAAGALGRVGEKAGLGLVEGEHAIFCVWKPRGANHIFGPVITARPWLSKLKKESIENPICYGEEQTALGRRCVADHTLGFRTIQDDSERLRAACDCGHRSVTSVQLVCLATGTVDRFIQEVEDAMRRIITIAIIVATATITTAWSLSTTQPGGPNRGARMGGATLPTQSVASW